MSEDKEPYGGTKKLKYREAADAVLGDPSISFWLKEAVKSLDQRDPVDTLKDVAILLKLQKLRVDEELGGERKE